MSQEKNRSFIYEKVGEVFCSPPELKYKDPNCIGKASLVCHHCKSPICIKCAVLIPDRDFPAFTELEKNPIGFYASLTLTIAMAILLFPLAHAIANFLHISEFPLDPFTITFQAISLKLPTIPLWISMNFLLVLVASLFAYAITKMCTTYVRREELTLGKRILKQYKKENMTAAHCRLCYEKYHKSKRTQRAAQLVTAILAIAALLVIAEGYLVGLVDLTFPIIFLLIAYSLRKIVRLTREMPISALH
jgi:hypothetical protein